MKPRPVSLALQGGGAHGAYTWGVLDAILEDPHLEPTAISGASAGAMNAAVMVSGLLAGGRQGARDNLTAFWKAVAAASPQAATANSPWNTLFGGLAGDVLTAFAEAVSKFTSPYDRNPLNLNPLKEIVAAHVDCEAIKDQSALQIYVAATIVRTGGLRVFSRNELSLDALLASACLPTMFQAVEIDDIPHWDGGYTANPPLAPLIEEASSAPDVVIVHINPLRRDSAPRSIDDIVNRMSEITFNAPLLAELRTIRSVRAARGRKGITGWLGQGAHKPRLHAITADEALGGFDARSQMETSWAFLEELHARGREAGRNWLDRYAHFVGRRETLDLDAIVANADTPW